MRKSKYSDINPVEVKDYYSSHTINETSLYFGFASKSSLENFLMRNNIVKTKEKSESKLFTQYAEITLDEKQQRYVVDIYNKMGIQKIAQHFSVTKQEIKNILGKFNIKLKYSKLNYEEYNWAKNEYLNNPVSVKKLARMLKLDPELLYDSFRNEGIQRRNKYVYNSDFFRLIDTEEKAYWLGFLSADGYIDAPDNKLVLETKYADRDHLKALIKLLCPMKTYYKKTIKRFDKAYDAAYAYFNSPEIVGDLISNGCTGAKTFTLKFPKENISSELLKHFIRGYFDGDGSVHPIKDRNGVYVEFCGNEDFLNDLQTYFEGAIEGYTPVKLIPKGNAFVFRKGGNNVSYHLYEYMYRGATVYLDRKYRIFSKSYGKI